MHSSLACQEGESGVPLFIDDWPDVDLLVLDEAAWILEAEREQPNTDHGCRQVMLIRSNSILGQL